MNKKLKNKIAALFAVLSVCSPQSSRATDNKKLVKGLAIGIPSVLLTGGVTWGVVELVKYLKNKNNDQENKKPIGGNPGCYYLKGQELENAKKLIDDFLNQEWIVDKKSKNFCKEEAHKYNYKNFCAVKFKDIQESTLGNLDNQGAFHLKEFFEFYNGIRNGETITISKFASISGNDYKILEITDFGFKMRIEFDVKNNKASSLEFWRYVQGDNVCHWYFLSKDIANN